MLIKYVNLQLNHFCPKDCFYCYLSKDSRADSRSRFYKWELLKTWLQNAPLDDDVYINLVTGELTYFPELIIQAVKEIRKIERVKAVKFHFSTVTNGDNPDVFLGMIKDGYLDTDSLILSFDKAGTPDIMSHCNVQAVEMLAPYVTVSTAIHTDSIAAIDETLDLMAKANVKSWEYYYLMNYKPYEDQDFLDKFKDCLKKICDFDKKNPSKVYNIEAYKNSIGKTIDKKQLWCSYGDDSVYITSDGLIIPCGAYAADSNYQTEESKAFLAKAPTLEDDSTNSISLCAAAREKTCRHTCDFTNCNVSQCAECGMASSGNHCAIRKVETDVFKEEI